MAKSYIKLFYDFADKTVRLSDEEVGRLVRGMLIYANTGVETEAMVGPEQYLFPVFKEQIDTDNAAYAEVSAKRKAAGSRGGKAKVANSSKCYQDIKNNNDSNNNLNNSLESVVVRNSNVSTDDSTYLGTDATKQIIALAMDRAAQYGHADDRSYILAILRDWISQGVKTVDDARRVIAEHDAKKRPVKQTAAQGYQQHVYTEADFDASFYYDPTRDFLEVQT